MLRVSVSSVGSPADGDSELSTISADGRYVAFFSAADNLVARDENGTWDLFLRDLSAGTTRRVSVGSGGGEADDSSWGSAALSRHGRYVAFESSARNLVPGDTNGMWDVFVRDRATQTTRRVSVSTTGAQGNGGSTGVAISSDGRYVAFSSRATNLVAGDTNRREDLFVHDRSTRRTVRVSVRSDGTQANGHSSGAVVSAGGRYVGFYSAASNLVGGDTNGATDAFVRDLATGRTTRISVRSNEVQADDESTMDSISADGRWVSFASWATNLVPGDSNGVQDVFVRDRLRGTTRRMSVASSGTQGDGESLGSALSADGRIVTFHSAASTLVSGDVNGVGDVFVRDRVARTTRLVSIGAGDTPADGWSGVPHVSGNGRFVTFTSEASNLVVADANGYRDVFVRDLRPE